MPQTRLSSPLLRSVVIAGVGLLLMACGTDTSNDPSSADEATSATNTSVTTIEVTMTDYAYKPSSITIPAGEKVTLEFTNEGSVEHYFVVGDTIASNQEDFRQNLFSGVSITKNKQTEGHSDGEGEEEHEGEEGDHENEFELPPGGSGSMTFTLPASKAGRYTIACFETTGGEKHYQMGMEGTLTVTAPEE